MSDPYNLGGAKPRMFAGSQDILVTYGNAKKPGYYELALQGRLVCRRLELPEWLSPILEDRSRREPLLALLQSKKIMVPESEKGKRQGHIWFEPPPATGFTVPCVGVDAEVIDAHFRGRTLPNLQFVAYKFGKSEVERWRITGARFLELAKPIKPHEIFEAQYFIPVTFLER